MSKTDGAGEAESRISARIEPFWLNPATIKGTVAIAGGLLVLGLPDATLFFIRVIVGVALIISGTTDLWFSVRSAGSRGPAQDVVEALLTIAAGLLFLVFPEATLRAIMVIAGIYFGVRGITIAIGAIKTRGTGLWALNLARGVFFIAFAAILLILPEAVFAGLIVAIAVAAVILGGVILAYGIQHHAEDALVDVDAGSVSQIIRDWMVLQDVGDARRDEIDVGLYFEHPDRSNKLTAWWVMLLLSVAIATFGVLQDSTAVVIGAMLIAPLMTPIIGIAAGAVNGWPGRVSASLVMIAAGVGASIGLAFIIGAWAPAIVPLASNSQVTSRVNPNIIDMGIALAAGAAGAFANVNRRVSSSIAGVAIAVALVPPLGVVGLTLHAQMYGDSFGAFLLFLTNLVSIVLAAMIVFAFTGFAPISRLRENADDIKRVLITVVTVAMIIAIPLALTVSTILTKAAHQQAAQKDVTEWLGADTALNLVRVEVQGSDVAILVGGAGELPSLVDLEETLSESFGKPVTIEVEQVPTISVTYSKADGETRVEPGE